MRRLPHFGGVIEAPAEFVLISFRNDSIGAGDGFVEVGGGVIGNDAHAVLIFEHAGHALEIVAMFLGQALIEMLDIGRHSHSPMGLDFGKVAAREEAGHRLEGPVEPGLG